MGKEEKTDVKKPYERDENDRKDKIKGTGERRLYLDYKGTLRM